MPGDRSEDPFPASLARVSAAMLCTGVPAMAWGLWAFAQGGDIATPGALAVAMGGAVGAAGFAAALEASARMRGSDR